MPSHPRSATLERAEGEEVPSLFIGNTSEIVKATCHVRVSDLREEAHTEL